ncbi:MAG: cardiolipin synthase [Bacteroidota bacterium]|nr:cardiolipin synthase [Bacteroidota bacterium]MDP4211058.1 cardiolipin synthase [Bacteroidota bacterium]MDP4249206.1 cardiolipin synthase [Bacteroidota bacterium]
MDWWLLYEILYALTLIFVCMRIINDTHTINKTLSYLLFAAFVPFFGMIFYFIFGINYRKRKIYSKKLTENEDLANKIKADIYQYSKQTFNESDASVQSNKELAVMLLKDTFSPLTSHNSVKLLLNGENKFPEVLQTLKAAKHHIHIEYYIYEDDEIGREIGNVLIEKAKEGVDVRFIYDDFGSRSIRKRLVPAMKAAGVKAFPFFEIYFIPFANRLNYRNHRKIIVIDGHTAFVGGINISDRYINHPKNKKRLFWRDTHLRIDGPGVQYLQYLFLCDWNFCSDLKLQPDTRLFPPRNSFPALDDKVVQIAASGPDSESPSILYSILKAINLATKEILISTPYFIPGEGLIDALVIASLSGITVKLLVPDKSDSLLVNSAAKSYYKYLLQKGVEIYRYKKGFLHAKTLVADRKIAIVGTANMDFRSFDLNFEVNAIVYDKEIAHQLSAVFFEDLKDAEKMDIVAWNKRPLYKKWAEKMARLVSPLL